MDLILYSEIGSIYYNLYLKIKTKSISLWLRTKELLTPLAANQTGAQTFAIFSSVMHSSVQSSISVNSHPSLECGTSDQRL